MTSQKVCSFESCGRKHYGKGYCKTHYEQLRRGETVRPIQTNLGYVEDILTRLRFKSFRDSDGCLNYGRGLGGRGYGIIRIKSVSTTKAHVLAYQLAYGDVPEGKVVDHRCGNTRCIEPGHLRAATPKQNAENQTRLNTANTSGYRGVYWSKAHNYWVAKIVHNGKQITRTGFTTAEEANEEAIKLRNTYFTHNPEQPCEEVGIVPKGCSM